MKNSLKLSGLFMFVFVIAAITGCKKLDSDTLPVDYDIRNKVFRVHATTDIGIPFHITISESTGNSNTNVVDVNQSNGGDFNYGFTPGNGNTITVTVEANTAINCNAFYNGTNYGTIPMQQVAGGKYQGQLVKTISN
jgi:hypothetical protein